MMSRKSWEFVPFAACLLVASACATPEGTATEDVATPPAGSAGNTSAPTAGKTAGAAGAKSSAGTSGGSAGTAAASGELTAVAVLAPFMAAAPSSGAAGAASAAGAGGSSASAAAGAGGHESHAGTGGATGSTTAGTGGKAGAGGTGTGSGLAALSGTATFTKKAGAEVSVVIDVTGCEDGKSYPVHIHAGTSCESVATQMGHWGAPPAPEPNFPMYAAGAGGNAAAGAGGSAAGAAGSAAGAAGSTAAAAAGAGGSTVAAAGAGGSTAGGAAGGGAVSFMYRGEGINDIKCTGTTGTTSARRNSFDKRVLWTIGTMEESDIVGHVVVVHDGAARIACGKIELK